jgi:hypothetical protein
MYTLGGLHALKPTIHLQLYCKNGFIQAALEFLKEQEGALDDVLSTQHVIYDFR